VFKMGNESARKEIKLLVYFLIFVWLLNIVIWGYAFYTGMISVEIGTVIVSYTIILPLILMPIVVIGLWKLKRWGSIMGYILSIFLLIASLISLNIIGIIIWGIILFFLYKYRNIFA